MEELAVPFSPKLRRQHELKVSCVPFSISPIPLLEVIKSLAPSQTKLLGSARLDPKSVDFTMVRCLYRLYSSLVRGPHTTFTVGRVSGPAPDVCGKIRLGDPKADHIHFCGQSALERCTGIPSSLIYSY